MKIFIYISLISAKAYSVYSLLPISMENDDRIIGGYPVEIEDHPYQVKLFKFDGHFCGGIIYSENIIITAAHCTIMTDPASIRVIAGTKYKNGTKGVIVTVKEIIMHELFDYPTVENDIALLVLDKPLPINNKTMKAVQLAENHPKEGEIATITGWGWNGNANPSTLYAVQVNILSDEICKEAHKEFSIHPTDAMFCAAFHDDRGKDACTGDSGGPLVFNNQLVGIVSWGVRCADPDFPGVFTKVSHFRTWVQEKEISINNAKVAAK